MHWRDSAFGFGAARFALGLSEAGNFPAAIKTIAEWFPTTERALATGIFNSGSNVGAIVAPLVVPWIATRYGWQSAFVITGASGSSGSPSGSRSTAAPRSTRGSRRAELAYIRSDPPEPDGRDPLGRAAPHRQTWAFAAGKFLTDPIWWFYLFWLPKFLNEKYGINLTDLGPPSSSSTCRRRRQHRRRLAVVDLDPPRLDGQRRAQDGAAGLRAVRRPDRRSPRGPRTCGSRWC